MHRPVQPRKQTPSFLVSCIFRLSQQWIFEFPRISHPSAIPAVNLQVTLNLRSPAAPLMSRRVTPTPASSGYAEGKPPGCPESSLPRLPPADGNPSFLESHPPAAPSIRLRVAPNSALTARPMMTPRFNSNFASSGKPADESSCPIGSCTFPPDSGYILNLCSAACNRFPNCVPSSSIESCIFPPG